MTRDGTVGRSDATERSLPSHWDIDLEAIVPFDDFAQSQADKSWIKSFFPAFMENSQTGGKTWGIPFQRSTIVLYWNKEAFKAAGLDPEKAPATWAEELDFAEKLTRRDGAGNTTQWGMQIPPLVSPIGCSRRSPLRTT